MTIGVIAILSPVDTFTIMDSTFTANGALVGGKCNLYSYGLVNNIASYRYHCLAINFINYSHESVICGSCCLL